MKIALGIIFLLIILIVGFFAWFNAYYLVVPPLEIHENSSRDQIIDKIDKWFVHLNELKKFNGLVLMIDDGIPLLSKGYGFTNYKENALLNEKSCIRLASVSKQFTAAGIMLLQEKGKLDYDDLVSTIIDSFPYEDVTIRDLLNQVSGIPDLYWKLAKKYKNDFEILTNEIAVNLLIRERKKARSKPGEKFNYSNTNYIILAYIIEVLTGISFEKFMTEELFVPLGMDGSRVWNLESQESTFADKVDSFERIKDQAIELNPTFIDGIAGDGGVFSSLNDLVKWDKFWYDNILISQSNLQEAFKKVTLKNGTTSNYGFGWAIAENGMWHNGSWLGVNTMINRNVERRTCVVILDNSSNMFFNKIIKELKIIDNLTA